MGSVLSGSAVSSSSPHQSEKSEVDEMPPSSSSDDWYDPAQVRKGGPSNVKVPDISALLARDGNLRDHEREIREVHFGTIFIKAVYRRHRLEDHYLSETNRHPLYTSLILLQEEVRQLRGLPRAP